MAQTRVLVAWALSDTSSGEGLRGLVARAVAHASISSDAKSCLEADLARGELSLPSMRTLVQYLNANEGADGRQLHQYLQGGRLAFPASRAVPAAPSEELVQRREYLKLRQEAREYNRMVYGTEQDPRVQEILDAGNHYASARNQLAISANMVMSVLASFAIAYYAGKSFKASSTTCLVCGLLGAIAIMFVEMGLFIVRASKVEQTASRDARRAAAEKLGDASKSAGAKKND